MHRLLKQMGREIVKKQSLEEPGKRQFLWDANEIFDVLEGNTVSFFFFSYICMSSVSLGF